MSRVQAVAGPRKPAAKRSTKRMYRGVITAQAIQDVFIRATSDAAANTAIKVGKGQRMKPRFDKWQLLLKAVAVDGYAVSTIPASGIPRIGGLTESELGKIYVEILHNISLTRAAGMYTDSERQAMADAVREFYELATEVIRAKAVR